MPTRMFDIAETVERKDFVEVSAVIMGFLVSSNEIWVKPFFW